MSAGTQAWAAAGAAGLSLAALGITGGLDGLAAWGMLVPCLLGPRIGRWAGRLGGPLAACLLGLAVWHAGQGAPVDQAVGLVLVGLLAWLRLARPAGDRSALLVGALLWVAASVRTEDPAFLVLWAGWAISLPLAAWVPTSGRAPATLRRRAARRLVLGTWGGAWVVFLALPRLAPPLPDPLTGVAASVTLGAFDALLDDPTWVASVQGLVDAEEVVLRVGAFERFDGQRWTVDPEGPVGGWMAGGVGEPVQVRHADLGGWLAVPGGVVAWAGQAPEPGVGGRWWTPQAGEVVWAADVVPGAPVGPATLSEADRQALVRLPPQVDARIVALAEQLDAPGDDAARMARVVAYVAEGHGYTRRGPAPGHDALESFLFDTRAGHCELFATAVAVLLRAQGVPARVATGFVGGVRHADGWTLQRLDAHAWTEVHLDGTGWVPADATALSPTPPEGVPPTAFPGPSASGRPAIPSLRRWQLPGRWMDSVVRYGAVQQRALLARIGQAGQVVAALVVLAVVASWWRRRRRSRAVAAHRGARGGVAQVWDHALALVAAEGWHPPPTLPPVATGAWLAANLPAIGPLLQRLAWLHAEVQFGGVADAVHQPEAEAILASLRAHTGWR